MSCREISERFCASLANGHPRCPKGTCANDEPEPESADAPAHPDPRSWPSDPPPISTR